MLKHLLLLFLITCCLSPVNGQAPGWEWAKKFGGGWDETPAKIRADGFGHIYLAGNYLSSKFGIGNDTLVNPGGTNMFIAKLDTSGHVIWARSAGGIGVNKITDMDLDSVGNIYFTGTFDNLPITFDTITLVRTDRTDMFAACYDTTGHVVWARKFGGDGIDAVSAITVAKNGTFLLSGIFTSTRLIFYRDTLENPLRWSSYFMAKFNAQGNNIWAQAPDSGDAGSWITGTAIDGRGAIYATGRYSGPSLKIGATRFSNPNGYKNFFLAKYDSAGTNIWAKSYEHICANSNSYVRTDGADHIYFAGNLNSGYLNNLGPGNPIPVRSSLFLTRMDTAGNILWLRTDSASTGSCDANYFRDLMVDATGHAYVTGSFYGPDIRFSQYTLNSNWSYDIFVIKYDSAGAILWVKTNAQNVNLWNASRDGLALAMDPHLNLYNAGTFFVNPMILDSITLTCNGQKDMYLAKIRQCWLDSPVLSQAGMVMSSTSANDYQWFMDGKPVSSANTRTYTVSQPGSYHVVVSDSLGCKATSKIVTILPNDLSSPHEADFIRIYPNPGHGVFFIELVTGNATVKVTNMIGQEVIYTRMAQGRQTFHLDENGIYIVNVTTEKGRFVHKIQVFR